MFVSDTLSTHALFIKITYRANISLGSTLNVPLQRCLKSLTILHLVWVIKREKNNDQLLKYFQRSRLWYPSLYADLLKICFCSLGMVLTFAGMSSQSTWRKIVLNGLTSYLAYRKALYFLPFFFGFYKLYQILYRLHVPSIC